MKLIHIIALALAFSASYPVYAQANKSGVKTFASRQEDPLLSKSRPTRIASR